MNVSNNKDLIVGRVLLSGLTYLITFGMAYLIGAGNYGEVAFYIYLVKSIPLFTLGMAQGIIYKEYSESGVAIRSYTYAYTFIVTLVLIAYGFINGMALVLVTIPFCLIHIIEPFLKTRKDFLAMLYVEFLCALSFLLVWALWGENESTGSLIGIFIISTMLVFVFFFSRHELLIAYINNFLNYDFSINYVKELILRGFGSYLFNFAYFFYIFMDRTLVNKFYSPSEFGSIMLAFQLSIIAGFIPAAINSRAIVDLGEDFKKNQSICVRSLANRLFKMISTNALFLLIVISLYLMIGDLFFKGYDNVNIYLLIFGVSLVVFNGYGSVAPVVFYMKKQIIPAVLMIVSVIFMILFHIWGRKEGLSVLLIELINFSILSILCASCIIYVFAVVLKDRNQGS